MSAPDFATAGQAFLAIAGLGAMRLALHAWDQDRRARAWFDVSFDRELAVAWLGAAALAWGALGFWWGRS